MSASAADDYDPKARQAIFGLFAVAGGMGYLILPRAQVIKRTCKCCVCERPPDCKRSCVIAFFEWLNLCFIGFYLAVIILYEVDAHMKDLGDLTAGPNIFLYSAAMGAVAAFLFVMVPVLAWSLILWLLVANIVAAQFYECQDSQCVGVRFVVASFGAFLFSLGFWMVGTCSRLVTRMQYYFASSFTVVFAVASCIHNVDYYTDEVRPIFPLLATIGLSLLRYLYIKAREHLVCCGALDRLSQDYERVEEEAVREEDL